MADGGRLQKVWHVAVIDRRVELDRFADRTQAGTQDDPAPRPAVPAAADVCGGFIDLCGEMEHRIYHRGTEDTEKTWRSTR